ncbi:MAG: cation transporter dimerization domain-containing protein, partial [Bacteroidota bacterium]
VVIVGLVGASVGYPKADAVAAFAVAILVIIVTLRLLKRTVDALMDRVPEGLYAKIKETAEGVDGIEQVSHLRIRQAGSKTFVDMTVDIRRTIPFELAHNVVDEVEETIRRLVPHADVVIHPEPVMAKDESVADKVRMIALEAGVRTHNIYAHKIGQRYYVDLHLEYRDTKGFEDAHRVATDVEERMLQKIPEVGKVKIHIDEPSDVVMVSKDITSSSLSIVERMRKIAMTQKGVKDCTDITVIDMGDGKIKVVMNCIFDNSLSFDEVHHLVTSIENRIYQELRQVFKVVIHAEPVAL